MFPVLIVDDAREDLILAERVLRSCKILNPMKAMTSGEECLSFFQGPNAQPCLVFLDLVMTPVSGLDVLAKLRDSQVANDSIFVMLSGISDIKLLREAYQLGAKTFLVKPLNTEDVLDFLDAVKQIVYVHEKENGYSLEWLMPPQTALRTRSRETARIFTVRE